MFNLIHSSCSELLSSAADKLANEQMRLSQSNWFLFYVYIYSTGGLQLDYFHCRIFFFDESILIYEKASKNSKKKPHNVWRLNVISSGCLFCPNNSSKLKYVHSTLMYDKVKQMVFTFEKLEPANVWHFCLKNDKNYESIMNIVDFFFSLMNQLID